MWTGQLHSFEPSTDQLLLVVVSLAVALTDLTRSVCVCVGGGGGGIILCQEKMDH